MTRSNEAENDIMQLRCCVSNVNN